jgi:hypothetical protein
MKSSKARLIKLVDDNKEKHKEMLKLHERYIFPGIEKMRLIFLQEQKERKYDVIQGYM